MALRAAVIGGGAGGRLSMEGLARSERFELVAACDLRPEVCQELARLHPGLRTFADHRALLAEVPVDVVCVSTFPPSHEAVTMDALEHTVGGLLVEKPLGDTAASGRRILEAVRERGVPVAVPHNLLVAPHAVAVVERVRAGEIGALRLVEIQCRGWDIINAGIHWLNFFATLTEGDPPVEVLALADRSTRTFRDGMQVETLAVTSARTASGVRVVMHTGDHTRVNAEGADCCFRLVGDAGLIEFHGWAPRHRVLNAAHPGGEWFEAPRAEGTGHQRHLETLADQIDAGVADLGMAERSLLALEMCEGAYRSSREGRAIRLPLAQNPAPAADDWDPGRPYDGRGGGRDGRRLEAAE